MAHVTGMEEILLVMESVGLMKNREVITITIVLPMVYVKLAA